MNSTSIRLNTKLITSLSTVLFIPAADVINASGIANSTWYNMMQKPEGITIQQLLGIANGLHVPVRRFFSTDRADVIGKRDDYVAEPYIQCRYDEDALREFVTNRPATTWKSAADAIGMSWSRLRDSLLAVTRTPVVRFIEVCRFYDIDPFTILIDPNPIVNGRRRKSAGTAGSDIRAEIKTLSSNIEALTKTVEDLTEKYDSLLKAHEQLARRIQVNIGTISGGNISNIGIAADD